MLDSGLLKYIYIYIYIYIAIFLIFGKPYKFDLPLTYIFCLPPTAIFAIADEIRLWFGFQ